MGGWIACQTHDPNNLTVAWQEETGYDTPFNMIKEEYSYVTVPLSWSMIPVIPDDMKTLAAQIGDIVKTNSWLMVFAEDESEFMSYYQDMVDKAETLASIS